MININVKELDKYNFENCEINLEFLEKLIKELDNKNQEIEKLKRELKYYFNDNCKYQKDISEIGRMLKLEPGTMNDIKKQIGEKYCSLEKEIKRLNNIIKPEKYNYDYLKLLFENKSKEDVINAFTYKCEQLDHLYNTYNKVLMESIKKDNIIKEVKEYINKISSDPNVFGHYAIEGNCKKWILEILDKGSDK